MTGKFQVFSLNGDAAIDPSIASRLQTSISPHEQREFEDGEFKIRPLVSVRGADVFVLDSLAATPDASPSDKLVRLAFFVGALKDASAASVTAVVPYLAFARKDRRTKARDPLGTRYVAQLLESVGLDRIAVLDVHNLAAYQNAFRIPAEHLEARLLIARAIAPLVGDREVAVVSPDAGGAKRAEAFRLTLARTLGRPVSNAQRGSDVTTTLAPRRRMAAASRRTCQSPLSSSRKSAMRGSPSLGASAEACVDDLWSKFASVE